MSILPKYIRILDIVIEEGGERGAITNYYKRCKILAKGRKALSLQKLSKSQTKKMKSKLQSINLTLLQSINLTLSKITIFLLLGIWLSILVFHKNYVFLIINCIFLIGDLVIRKNYLIFLAAIILISMFLYSPVLYGFMRLSQSNFIALSHPEESLRLILTSGTGKELLTHQVLKMLDLMEIHDIPNYQISTKLAEDFLISQRITESSWPIRRENDSPYCFLYGEEMIDFNDCPIVDVKESIYLVNCQ